MRMVKRLYLLLPFLIMLILLCGQLPELLSFVDDTSNDFEEEPLAHVPESVKLATVKVTSQRSIVFPAESNGIAFFKPSRQSALCFPPDLRRLLCIQRK